MIKRKIKILCAEQCKPAHDPDSHLPLKLDLQ